MKQMFLHQHRRGWQSRPPPAIEAMRPRLRAAHYQRKVTLLCRFLTAPLHFNLLTPTNLSADKTNFTSQHRFEGVHQCSPVPRPCGRGQARANTMVRGERRSRQKNLLLKNISPLTSLFFAFYERVVSAGWRVYINVPRPRGLADAARCGLIQW